jgi:uncharacterized repeat protein (TIGR01451 family)
MKFLTSKNLYMILLVGALATGLAPAVLAQNTPANTQINNTATLDYFVGATQQAQVVSNTATFRVDNKVDLTVNTVDGAIVSVVPGTFARVLTYSVTNEGNGFQDYTLAALPSATGAFGETETFDAVNVNVYADSDADGAYTAADTDLYIDELAPGVSIRVFIVADIPLAQVNDDVASYHLLAQTARGNSPGAEGAPILSDDSGTPDDPATVQIVFADDVGTADGARDGRFSSLDGFKVVTASLTALKSSTVISDPFNLGSDPKAIPGATVGYQILVTNTGAVTADNVAVIDPIPANSAFLVGSVSTVPAAGVVVSYSNDGGLTWAYGPVAGPNGADPAVTGVRVVFPTVAGAATAQENFSVLID